MHVIITRSHSAEPLAAFAIRGIWPILAAAALVAIFALAVWHTAVAVTERWAQSGHPLLAEVVRVRLDENEDERRALLREKIRLQNDAIADLQVRLWRVERSGAAIAENLNLPAGLFPPSDSLMTGVDDNIQPILCRGDSDAEASADFADSGEEETAASPASGGGDSDSESELETAADFADSLSGLDAEISRLENGYAAAGKRAAAVEVLRRTIPIERPLAGKHWRTSLFGYRKDPFTGRRAFHSGYDYAAERGSPVVAAADGVVVYGGRLGNYGNVVQVYHGGGVSTLYGHMRDILAEPWAYVRRGDKIGTVGNTGRSTGPHLHYEIRFDNRPQPVRKAIKTLKKRRGA